MFTTQAWRYASWESQERADRQRRRGRPRNRYGARLLLALLAAIALIALLWGLGINVLPGVPG